MAYRIRLQSTGHSFESHPRESILHAGLNAGLNLTHSCENGSCGECKARLLQGNIEAIKHSDFTLTELERADNQFLMCCHQALSDCRIEAAEVNDPADIPEQRLLGKIGRVEQLNDQVVEFSVRLQRSKGLKFLAGQSVSLFFDGMRPKSLPMANCPCDSSRLRFQLRRRDDAFSEFVFNTLKKGREVIVAGPQGDFALDEESDRSLLFIAWESGFAPISSLIDHAISQNPDRRIRLIWLGETASSHYLENQCRAWRDALEDFDYQLVKTNRLIAQGFHSTIQQVLKQTMPIDTWDLYMTVPPSVQYAACQLFCEAGLPATQIKVALMQHA
jgi:CDP-4-dehydro-6-deoxyglucose reductase